MVRGKWGIALVIAALGVLNASANAATLTVNTTQDNHLNSDEGMCTLREAITTVNSPGTATECGTADASANTIVLGADTYKLTDAIPELFIGGPPPGCFSGLRHSDDNVEGDLTVLGTAPKLTIQGAGTQSTVVDACKLGDRALALESGTNVTLRNLTITNGNAPAGFDAVNGTSNGQDGGPGGTGENGGGILNQGTLALDHVRLSDSHAGNGVLGGTGHDSSTTAAGGSGGEGGFGGAGGGIYNASGASLSVLDSTVVGNVAGTGAPGGVGGTSSNGNGGAGGSGGAGGNGGGIENFGGLTVFRSTLTANQAGAGGDGESGKPVNPALSANGGAGGSGGGGGSGAGLAALNGTVSMLNDTIEGNTAGTGGHAAQGGAGPSSGGTPGKGGNGGSGGSGGGVAETHTSTSLASLTIANNGAEPGQPGAAAVGTGQAGAKGNDGVGGGVFVTVNSTATLQETVLDANKLAGTTTYENCGTTGTTQIATVILDGGHNIAYAPPSLQTLHHPGACPSTFTAKDPKLGPLQDNLGPTLTMALAPGSPAIDQVPSDGGSCPSTDQRGFKRPSGPACDIGAYEVTPPAVSTGPATKIAKSTATINGKVTANAKSGTVHFQFGKTTSYGNSTPAKNVTGVTPTTISASLKGLGPNTTYHFRVVATSQDGTSRSADATFKTKANPPVISKLKIKLKSGKATLTYKDSQKAKTTFIVRRCTKRTRKGRCLRWVRVLSFSHKDGNGHNTVKFTPPHKKGHYQVIVTPKAGGVKGKSRKVSFRVT